MLGFGHRREKPDEKGPRVSTRLCTNKFNGKYPHVGLYDVRNRQVWVCKPLSGQAIRTSHAALITGADNATSVVAKDRFLCFWMYTPNTGQGLIHGYPIEWDEAHLLVRVDPNWDYDRLRAVPSELEDHVAENLDRQIRHGERVFNFYLSCKLKYPLSLHFIAQRAADSSFYVKRFEPG